MHNASVGPQNAFFLVVANCCNFVRGLRNKHLGVAMTLVLFTCAAAFGQTAEITGRIVDPSGSVVPGAEVTVSSIATGADRVVKTNSSGYYTVPLLSPGEYRVSVQYAGFRTIVRSGVRLAVDQHAELGFTLEIGGVADKIEVEANAPQLNTVNASQGQVIENRRIVELPLNGRTYDDLALLSAGTVQPLSGARFVGFSSGGMRDTQNNFLLDGIDNNPVELAGAQRRSEMVQPSIDGIQEFKVQTNSYAAEYGRALGAVVNVTTKSGTNDLHGTAFEFVRNEKLDAKNYFTVAGAPNPPFKRNQYGFSIGGPVVVPKMINGRNKLFFFGDYEGTKIRQTANTVNTIPTLAMRRGDFSELQAQRKVTIIDPSNGNPFPNNAIPTARLDPLAVKLVNLYPTPMTSTVGSNFTYQSPSNQDVTKFDVRADATLGNKDNVFWRMSQQHATLPAVLTLPAPAYGGNPLDSNIDGVNTSATWNHIFTPAMILSRARRLELWIFRTGQSVVGQEPFLQPGIRNHRGNQFDPRVLLQFRSDRLCVPRPGAKQSRVSRFPESADHGRCHLDPWHAHRSNSAAESFVQRTTFSISETKSGDPTVSTGNMRKTAWRTFCSEW